MHVYLCVSNARKVMPACLSICQQRAVGQSVKLSKRTKHLPIEYINIIYAYDIYIHTIYIYIYIGTHKQQQKPAKLKNCKFA